MMRQIALLLTSILSIVVYVSISRLKRVLAWIRPWKVDKIKLLDAMASAKTYVDK